MTFRTQCSKQITTPSRRRSGRNVGILRITMTQACVIAANLVSHPSLTSQCSLDLMTMFSFNLRSKFVAIFDAFSSPRLHISRRKFERMTVTPSESPSPIFFPPSIYSAESTAPGHWSRSLLPSMISKQILMNSCLILSANSFASRADFSSFSLSVSFFPSVSGFDFSSLLSAVFI